MYKKILLLILFGLVEHKCIALCCFSKKALERPAPAHAATPVPEEEPDAATLRAINSYIAGIKKSGELVKSLLEEGAASGVELHRVSSQIASEQMIVKKATLVRDLCYAIKLLQNDKNYENFLQSFHADVFHESRGHFYADDKKLHERDLGLVLPFPSPLIGIVSSYLWQQGKSMEVHSSENGFIDSISIFDAQGKEHMLTSPQSRTIFGRISSLRIMPYPYLEEIDLLQGYGLKNRPQDPEEQAAEDRALHVLFCAGITNLTLQHVKERQLLLVPVID